MTTFEEELNELNSKLEAELDFLKRMEILDKINDLKVRYNLVEKPNFCSNQEDCLMCGS